jgi:hypothetical protein
MIDNILFEQRIIQNTGLAAETIWQTVYESYEMKNRTEGIVFPLAFLILPITFHQRTANALASKTQPGAIYKALADDREIPVGLQIRMQALAERTFQALSLAFSSDLIKLDLEKYQLIPGRKTPPVTHVTDDVRIILNAAKRVGQTFAELSVNQIASYLEIKF